MSSFSCRLWRGRDSEMISLIHRRTAQISKTDHRNVAPGVCLMTLFLCDICFSAILYANELGRRRHLVSSSPSSQICFDNIDCLARDDNCIYMQQIWLWGESCDVSRLTGWVWMGTNVRIPIPLNQHAVRSSSDWPNCKTSTSSERGQENASALIAKLQKSLAVL